MGKPLIWLGKILATVATVATASVVILHFPFCATHIGCAVAEVAAVAIQQNQWVSGYGIFGYGVAAVAVDPGLRMA
jgi:hypothetical protein